MDGLLNKQKVFRVRVLRDCKNPSYIMIQHPNGYKHTIDVHFVLGFQQSFGIRYAYIKGLWLNVFKKKQINWINNKTTKEDRYGNAKYKNQGF